MAAWTNYLQQERLRKGGGLAVRDSSIRRSDAALRPSGTAIVEAVYL
jgi:hypothetical protein